MGMLSHQTRSEMMTEAAAAAAGEALPDYDEMAEELIRECGSERGAIIVLLARLDILDHELAMTKPVVSRGYTRGWHHRGH